MNFFLASDYEVRWRHLAKRAGQPHAFAGVNDIGDDAPGMVRGPGRGNLVDAVAESERSAVSRISGMGADVDILRMRIDSFQCSGGGGLWQEATQSTMASRRACAAMHPFWEPHPFLCGLASHLGGSAAAHLLCSEARNHQSVALLGQAANPTQPGFVLRS